MDKFLFEHLEPYLAGQLGPRQRRQFEKRLSERPRDRRTIDRMAEISGLFSGFENQSEPDSGPLPGFHLRVLRRVREQRTVAWWETLSRPFVLRRVAVAVCVWLVAIAGAGLYQASAQPVPDQIARSVLALAPESADYCNVRLGCDIDLNRSTMLAVVMEAGARRW